jgi:membrane associated rhomboid family serine protease
VTGDDAVRATAWEHQTPDKWLGRVQAADRRAAGIAGAGQLQQLIEVISYGRRRLRRRAEQPNCLLSAAFGALVTTTSEPIFNVPGFVLAIIAICALVLAGQTWLLTDDDNTAFLYCFGFVPARYDGTPIPAGLCPRGTGAEAWTFVTYAFIHGDITHLTMNAIWFLPFGSAVARRFGTLRALAFFAVTAVGGALMHLVTHWGEQIPMIGASGAVSGFMAGAIRFAFQRGGPLAMFRTNDPAAYFVPAAPLAAALQDSRIVAFLLMWFGLNLVVGLLGTGVPGDDQTIAWEAHIGGFLAGLLLFPLFDPVPARAA